MSQPKPSTEVLARPDLRAYWETVWKNRLLILTVTGVMVAVVALWTLRQPKIYSASTSVVIELSAPQVLTKVQDVYDPNGGQFWGGRDFYTTQVGILSSRDLARRVVERLGLDKDPAFLGLGHITDRAALAA